MQLARSRRKEDVHSKDSSMRTYMKINKTDRLLAKPLEIRITCVTTSSLAQESQHTMRTICATFSSSLLS